MVAAAGIIIVNGFGAIIRRKTSKNAAVIGALSRVSSAVIVPPDTGYAGWATADNGDGRYNQGSLHHDDE